MKALLRNWRYEVENHLEALHKPLLAWAFKQEG